MAYISLYRKWRPQGFLDVAGQDNIVKTLENSLNSGRVSHAYLFTGPRGTGKTTVARILAKSLNCHMGPTATPCGTCEECQTVTAGTSLNVIEIDGASNNGVDDVRELREQVQFTPINAKYKVYIIDEVHMLSTAAFNALLKTLEEPPAHVVFIFATTDPHRLPATILSRVQRYDFQRFSEEAMVARLKTVVEGDGIHADTAALRLIAQHAGGGMRDALSILEKCSAFAEQITGHAVVEVLGVAPQEQIDVFARYLLEDSKGEALQIIDDLYNHGKDLNQFALSVVAVLRRGILEGAASEETKRLSAIELLSETVRDMRFAPDPRISLELAILKITTTTVVSNHEMGKLEEKVRGLEKEISKLTAQLADQSRESVERPKPVASVRHMPSAGDEERSSYVLEIWADYLKGLRSERLMQCEAFLKEGQPIEVAGDQVIVAFPRERGFHKASIEQDNHREPAERVLAKLLGTSVQLKCIFQDEVAGAPKPTSPAATKAEQKKPVLRAKPEAVKQPESQDEKDAESEEFLKASLETFGGKLFTKSKEQKTR